LRLWLSISFSPPLQAGGDSAARAVLVGSWLGAFHGASALPARWVAGLQAAPEVKALVGSLRGATCGASAHQERNMWHPTHEGGERAARVHLGLPVEA